MPVKYLYYAMEYLLVVPTSVQWTVKVALARRAPELNRGEYRCINLESYWE